jgi:Pyruvate/2-oxoacid:ferredoxin oxidoreductase gamma subunit
LKTGGWAVVNSDTNIKTGKKIATSAIDADKLAQEISNPKSANLIVLGFALAKAGQKAADRINLFCSLSDIKKVLKKRLGSRKKLLDASIKALEAGYKEFKT